MATTLYNVKMTCQGCSNAINRIITKNQEKLQISEYDISLESQQVSVTHGDSITPEEILEVLKKSGKEVSLK